LETVRPLPGFKKETKKLERGSGLDPEGTIGSWETTDAIEAEENFR